AAAVEALGRRVRDLQDFLSGRMSAAPLPTLEGMDRQQLAEMLQSCTDREGKPSRTAVAELFARMGLTAVGPLERGGKRFVLVRRANDSSTQSLVLEYTPTNRRGSDAAAVVPPPPVVSLDELVPAFWTQEEHAAAWRGHFQDAD